MRIAGFMTGLMMLLISRSADAGEPFYNGTQVHFRTGMVSGSFSGPSITGSFSVIPSLDFEYEMFRGTKSAYSIRAIICHDLATSNLVYYFGGVGRRFYFNSTGMAFEGATGGTTVLSVPKRRYYAGVDVGISQLQVDRRGPVLQIQSSLLDFGGNVGAIFQMGKQLGLELQAGFQLGMGFSSVAVSGSTMRILAGASYYF
jgi:hypothetical protein